MNSILVATVVCPHCRHELESKHETCPRCGKLVRTQSAEKQHDELRVIDRPWVLAVLLLHVGFLGIPIYLKTSYSLTTRLLICLVSIAYTVFAVGFIVVVGTWLYRQFTGG